MVKPKLAVRSLSTPLRMFDGMDEEAHKKQVEVPDGPVLSERDRAKLERRKRKDERQREASSICLIQVCLCHFLMLVLICLSFRVITNAFIMNPCSYNF